MLKASVIIPSYDRQMITLETLGHLNDQTETKFEVIVVDQTEKKSKDLELFQFRNSSMGYKYVRIKEIGLPNARNIGVNYASANLVIFIDDDCIPHPRICGGRTASHLQMRFATNFCANSLLLDLSRTLAAATR